MIANWNIVERVSTTLNVSETTIFSKTRKWDVVDARCIIAFKIYEKTGLQLHLIFDIVYPNRPTKQRHCSVVNLLKRYENLSRFNREFKNKIEACKDI